MRFSAILFLTMLLPVFMQAQGLSSGKKLLKGYEEYDSHSYGEKYSLSRIGQYYYDKSGQIDTSIIWQVRDGAPPHTTISERKETAYNFQLLPDNSQYIPPYPQIKLTWQPTVTVTEYYDENWNFTRSDKDSVIYDPIRNKSIKYFTNLLPEHPQIERETDSFTNSGFKIYSISESYNKGHWEIINGSKMDSFVNANGSIVYTFYNYKERTKKWLQIAKEIYYYDKGDTLLSYTGYDFKNGNWVGSDSTTNINWFNYKRGLHLGWNWQLEKGSPWSYNVYSYDTINAVWYMRKQCKFEYYTDSFIKMDVIIDKAFAAYDSEVYTWSYDTEKNYKYGEEFYYDKNGLQGNGWSFKDNYDSDDDLLSSYHYYFCSDTSKCTSLLDYTLYFYLTPPKFTPPPPHITQYYYRTYPNPTSGILHIISPDVDTPGMKIYIYDLYGKVVGKYLNPMQNSTIDIGYLPDGVYVLDIESNKGENRSKIVKVSR